MHTICSEVMAWKGLNSANSVIVTPLHQQPLHNLFLYMGYLIV